MLLQRLIELLVVIDVAQGGLAFPDHAGFLIPGEIPEEQKRDEAGNGKDTNEDQRQSSGPRLPFLSIPGCHHAANSQSRDIFYLASLGLAISKADQEPPASSAPLHRVEIPSSPLP
jgi:hypothetical protein